MSFCIPVYNNAEAALELVKCLLVSERQDFEVIVSDDASSDNTQELLTQIKDSRFRYYRNDKNLGVHKNWLRTLELGRGEWLYLSMGRDRLHGECIGSLIEILERSGEENITYFKDGCRKPRIYSGINAMTSFIQLCHPTGDIFNAELFRKIPDDKRRRYFEISDMYPENYIRHDLLLAGRGAYIMSGVYQWEVLIDKVKVKSTVEHDIKNIYETYYAPSRRIKQNFEIIDMIAKDLSGVFNEKEINKIFNFRFYSIIYSVSLGWRDFCKDKNWQAHYGQEIRHVTRIEMLRNILSSYRVTMAYLKSQGLYSLSRELIMQRCILAVLTLPFRTGAKTLWRRITAKFKYVML